MASHHRPRHVVIVLAAVMMAGSACSDPATTSDKPQVATLASGGSSPAASASTAAAERPRERLDTTPEEYEAMLVPHKKCIRDHGAKPKEDWADRRPTQAEVDKLQEAMRVCDPLYLPLPPWEKDPANPEAKDFARDVVKCLKNKGIRYVAVGSNGVDLELGGANNDQESITKGMDLAPQCERDVAAHRK